MIVIDGGKGEGGGQILRSALALSTVTGRAFRIQNIRRNRRKPGLMRQHLTALEAAGSVSGARVTGAAIGATSLTFEPGPVEGGSYSFAVGTAGSATLVLQTVLPALILADAPSFLTLEGGTHNPYAPPFEFLDRAFLPLLRAMGPGIEARLHRPGFHPAGGGRFDVSITPVRGLVALECLDRGPLRERHAEAVVSNLSIEIAKREIAVVAERLGWDESELSLRRETRAQGPGNVLLLTLSFAHLTEVFVGFGERGVAAETVAEQTAERARAYLESDAALGHYLADQLLLPLALAGGGHFTTQRPSRHFLTNAEVIKTFIPITIETSQVATDRWEVTLG
jgi:RNA 3'-terminal phosphate cyclase (ATP)